MWLCLLRSLLRNSHPESTTQGGPEGWRCCRKRHLARGFDPERSQTPCQTLSFCLAFCLGSFFSWKLSFPAVPGRAKACAPLLCSCTTFLHWVLCLSSYILQAESSWLALTQALLGWQWFGSPENRTPHGGAQFSPCKGPARPTDHFKLCLASLGRERLPSVGGPCWLRLCPPILLLSHPCQALQPPRALLCSFGFLHFSPCDCLPHFLQPHGLLLGQFPCQDTRCC